MIVAGSTVGAILLGIGVYGGVYLVRQKRKQDAQNRKATDAIQAESEAATSSEPGAMVAGTESAQTDQKDGGGPGQQDEEEDAEGQPPGKAKTLDPTPARSSRSFSRSIQLSSIGLDSHAASAIAPFPHPVPAASVSE